MLDCLELPNSIFVTLVTMWFVQWITPFLQQPHNTR